MPSNPKKKPLLLMMVKQLVKCVLRYTEVYEKLFKLKS